MKNILVIGGTCDQYSVKRSSLIDKIFSTDDFKEATIINGIPLVILINTFEEIIPKFDIIFWFPNISNEHDKLVNRIKELNSKCILISSKNNNDEKYSDHMLVARMLKTKSNLMVEFKTHSPETGNLRRMRILDPLGNEWFAGTDIVGLRNALIKRIAQLETYTRVPSFNDDSQWQLSPSDYSLLMGSMSLQAALHQYTTLEQARFIGMAKDYAEKWHELIHSENKDRFLGNLSFRCESGFPSYRLDKELMLVSKRNVDKRGLTLYDMVPCLLNPQNPEVYYLGENKPSVDAAINKILYHFYPNVNYILHSHAYIEDVPFTRDIIPCGAIQEAGAVISQYPCPHFSVLELNLLGHGSIVLGNAPSDFQYIEYIPRPCPELHY